MIEPLRYDWKDMQPEMVVKGRGSASGDVWRLRRNGGRAARHDPHPVSWPALREGPRGRSSGSDEVEAMILSVDVRSGKSAA